MNVYSGFAYYHSNLERIQTSFHGKMFNKLWYIHSVDYYSEIEINKLLINTHNHMGMSQMHCLVK